MEVKFRTPISTGPPSVRFERSLIAQNANETSLQTKYIKDRISRHWRSFQRFIYGALDQIAKGTINVMHKVVSMETQVGDLEEQMQP